jgi:Peptidase_C39 like family
MQGLISKDISEPRGLPTTPALSSSPNSNTPALPSSPPEPRSILSSGLHWLLSRDLDAFSHEELDRLLPSEREDFYNRLQNDPEIQEQVQQIRSLEERDYIDPTDARNLIQKLTRPESFDKEQLNAWVPPSGIQRSLTAIQDLIDQGVSAAEIRLYVALGFQRGGAEGIAASVFTADAGSIIADFGWELSQIRDRFPELSGSAEDTYGLFREILLLEEERREEQERVAQEAFLEAQLLNPTGVFTPSPGSFQHFRQYEGPWARMSYGGSGTVGSSGCGPTSVATALSFLGVQNIDPGEMAHLAAANGFRVPGAGTSWGFFSFAARQNGLNVQELGASLGSINSQLALGRPVVIATNRMPFTQGGHITVIVGRDQQGNYQLADPGPRQKNTATSQELASALVNSWAFSRASIA